MPFCHIRLKGQRPLSRAYPKSLKTIGDHIRKRRLDLSLLQREVAEIIGVDETSVHNWEINKALPMLRCLPAIIAFLGYNPLPEPTTIAEKLVQYRSIRGIHQDELAKRIGVDPATLARWERGEREPSGKHLKQVEVLLARATSL